MSLINLIGPVNESDVPYTLADIYDPGPADGRAGNIEVTGYYFYRFSNGRDIIKNAIMDHGAVSTLYYDKNTYFSYSNNSYYCPYDIDTSHVIAIVGWDDYFPRENFVIVNPDYPPAGDGAWLVRNSWGTNDYDRNGYFWLSYYDASLSDYAYTIDASMNRYDHVYSYDNTPSYYYLNAAPSGTTLKQVFHVDGGEEIRAIGYYHISSPTTGLQFSVTSGDKTVKSC